jgi:D-lactate dehydrogenase
MCHTYCLYEMTYPGRKNTISGLRRRLGKSNVLTDHLSLIAYAADAGCYSKDPQIVVRPRTEEDVSYILRRCSTEKRAVTFRAAGTSLSGQSISNSVLLVAAGDMWRRTEVIDGGGRVRTQPGITGGRLNQLLKPYGVQFGPDPASINSAMIGGIIANNASGMSCGTHANSFATILSARIVFNDGTILDTADEKSRREFEIARPEIIKTVKSLKDRIRNNPELSELIKEKYRIKNTCGYGMNSFTEFDDPFEIILHLMVGSEGTLGFVSEATFRTVPLKPERASSMVYFKSLEEACDAVSLLKEAGVSAIELMDRQALRAVEDKPGIPEYIRHFNNGVAALLIDLEAEDRTGLETLIENAQTAIGKMVLEREFIIARDHKEILNFWNIRKGVFPSVGGMRKPGTAVIIEDVAVKLEHLTSAVTDMREMLDHLEYRDAVIYGHALDGNLHFIFSQDFEDGGEIKRYEKLIGSLVKLIVDKYNGSLKAEHGTGINMAPYVQYEWGSELYGMMVEIKNAFDPEAILNPGVVINSDPAAHLKNFKKLPVIDESVDKCIECGFCEINCLSTGYTLSARQRIVVQRGLSFLKSNRADKRKIKRIERRFDYEGDKTCATDGLCSVSCPVDIDTGVYIKKLREDKLSRKAGARFTAAWVLRNFGLVKRFMRYGLGTVNILRRMLGTKLLGAVAASLRFVTFKGVPQWNMYFPAPAKIEKHVNRVEQDRKKVVYFPSCINQVMGPPGIEGKQRSLMHVTEEVLTRAGYQVIFPDNMENLCCGMPWESKGFTEVADASSRMLQEKLLSASKSGTYPVLCDTSPCVYRMKRVFDKRLKIYEPVEFIHDFLLGDVQIEKLQESIAFHITCSSIKMGIEDKFRRVAEACVCEPLFPEDVGCCGFAGDKGFTEPELNDWALRHLRVNGTQAERGYSNSRTCEIGLSKNSRITYESVMYMMGKVIK